MPMSTSRDEREDERRLEEAADAPEVVVEEAESEPRGGMTGKICRACFQKIRKSPALHRPRISLIGAWPRLRCWRCCWPCGGARRRRAADRSRTGSHPRQRQAQQGAAEGRRGGASQPGRRRQCRPGPLQVAHAGHAQDRDGRQRQGQQAPHPPNWKNAEEFADAGEGALAGSGPPITEKAKPDPLPTGADLLESSKAIARRVAEISETIEDQNKRPKKTMITPSTREVGYATYYKTMQKRIEDSAR
jgi:hypothetical protein